MVEGGHLRLALREVDPRLREAVGTGSGKDSGAGRGYKPTSGRGLKFGSKFGS